MIQGIFRALNKRLRREVFLATPLSIVISPVYIIRRGLFLAIREFAPRFGGRILDYGCGSKPYESLFKRVDQYVGVDMLLTGHSHVKSRIDVFYDGARLPFADATFDGVVSFEVLEHVFNLEDALREIRRVLRPGGLLLITVPFAWDEHEAPYDFARYTCYGLRSILQRAGLIVETERKTAGYVLAIGQLVAAYLYQHVLPRGPLASRVAQLLVLFPWNLICLLFDAVLPHRQEFYCNNVVLARRPPDVLSDNQQGFVDGRSNGAA